jgi:hypothetical protein
MAPRKQKDLECKRRRRSRRRRSDAEGNDIHRCNLCQTTTFCREYARTIELRLRVLVASGKSLDVRRICLSLFGLAAPRKSLDARKDGPEEDEGAVRDETERDCSSGYNLLLSVHKTNWNGHPRSCHPQEVFAGKGSRRTRTRRNEGRRFAKASARLQLFATVVRDCVEFGVGLFGLATLRKELGARRTAQKEAEEQWTVSGDGVCQTAIGCYTCSRRIRLRLCRSRRPDKGLGRKRHSHSVHHGRRHTESGWEKLPRIKWDDKIWTCSDRLQHAQRR